MLHSAVLLLWKIKELMNESNQKRGRASGIQVILYKRCQNCLDGFYETCTHCNGTVLLHEKICEGTEFQIHTDQTEISFPVKINTIIYTQSGLEHVECERYNTCTRYAGMMLTRNIHCVCKSQQFYFILTLYPVPKCVP